MMSRVAVIAFVVLLSATLVDARQAGTDTKAAELTTRLGSGKTAAFAAAVPDDPSRFVAALHIPGLQLLVISGTYQAPSLLRELLLSGDYQRVYLDLNAAADREGRFFVEDLGADGLRPDRAANQPFDITWRNGVERTLYNGDWKAQKLSEAAYRARFAKDAADYAEVLQILLTAHAAIPPGQP